MDKMERNSGNKTHFIDVVSIMPCENSSWIMDSRIYGGGENPDFSEFTGYDRSSGTRSRIDRVYTDIKISSNTKINHSGILY